jgi:hypothetical protein
MEHSNVFEVAQIAEHVKNHFYEKNVSEVIMETNFKKEEEVENWLNNLKKALNKAVPSATFLLIGDSLRVWRY